ncbi:MAG: hypothetical protein AAB790_00145 [Patescibacteria group bacterium]
MKKLLYIVIGLVVIAGGWYWYANQQGSGGAVLPGAALNADVYPLYSGATWGEAYATSSPNGPVTVVLSVPVANTTNIAAVSMPFTKYYDDKLKAAGWTQDMAEEASGSGGNISFYRKGGEYIVVAFHSVFNVKYRDAPSECPCDVTLSLMSGIR